MNSQEAVDVKQWGAIKMELWMKPYSSSRTHSSCIEGSKKSTRNIPGSSMVGSI